VNLCIFCVYMKSILKKLTPRPLLNLYHLLMAHLAVLIYRNPSTKMIVIGVTGTKGKSSTSQLIAKVLEQAGYKVGLSTTIAFKIGKKEWINDKKMTMLGRFNLQNLLSKMVKEKCKYVIIETSSEGIAQYRHIGIAYDILVFTGLTPEHIETHGGFENYKQVKLKIFRDLEKRKNKKLASINVGGQTFARLQGNEKNMVKKTIIANEESEHAKDFLNFKIDKKIKYQESGIKTQDQEYKTTEIKSDKNGASFKLDNTLINLKLLGRFNIQNALAAASVALSQGINLETIKKALEQVDLIPGRMEVLYDKDFKVVVDYAHEPNSLERMYKDVASWPHNKIITVFGSAGGGRDKSKRPKMGALAAKYCDTIILTTEDTFEEDVNTIINDLAKGIGENGKWKIEDGNLLKIIDRREAIKKAIELAQKDDIVLVLGKGTEQKMVLNHGTFDWDDRDVTRQVLKEVKKS